MTYQNFQFFIQPVEQDIYDKKVCLPSFRLDQLDFANRNGGYGGNYNEYFDFVSSWFLLNSKKDIDKAEEDLSIDISFIRKKISHYSRVKETNSSLIYLDFDEQAVRKNLHLGRVPFNDSIVERFLEWSKLHNAYPMILMSDLRYYQKSVAYRRTAGFDSVVLSNQQVLFPKAEILRKSEQTYRLYLNDRLLVERVWDFNVDSDKFCYCEEVNLSKIPTQGLNFTLKTPLNLQFSSVLVNGVYTPAAGKSFSLES